MTSKLKDPPPIMFLGEKSHLSVFLAIVHRKDGGRGWSLFEGRLVHGGKPPVGSWIVLKVHKTISDSLCNNDPRIIMVEAIDENLKKVRAIEDYANIPCIPQYDDFVRAMHDTDGVCAVNCDFRLKKKGERVVLELCNPNLLNAENMNDVKLLECHNQEIIGWDGETLYLLGNGMLVRIVWTCWVDQLHLLKIIPLSGNITGTPREGRYFIPDGLVTIDNYGEEVQDVGNEHYMTPADFPDYPCCDDGFGFLHMEDACGIPKIPCELFHDSYDMYRMAEELRK